MSPGITDLQLTSAALQLHTVCTSGADAFRKASAGCKQWPRAAADPPAGCIHGARGWRRAAACTGALPKVQGCSPAWRVHCSLANPV